MELLIAMIIVALLAVLVTPRLSLARDKAFVATMKSDLRNFAQSEESFFYDHAVYSSSLAALTATGLQISDQVTLTVTEATDTGWAVTANHALSDVQCAIFVGTASPVGAATEEGIPTCL